MVTGGSYGGYMTLAVATTYDDRICCSLDVVGISNFATLPEEHRELPARPPAGRVRRRARPGDARVLGADRAAEQRREDHQAAVRGPGRQRPAGAAKRGGADGGDASSGTPAPVWYLLAKDEGHGFRKKANADFQFYATVQFIRTYLLSGDEMRP